MVEQLLRTRLGLFFVIEEYHFSQDIWKRQCSRVVRELDLQSKFMSRSDCYSVAGFVIGSPKFSMLLNFARK